MRVDSVSASTLPMAVELLRGIIDLRRAVRDHHDPLIRSAHAAHKQALAQMRLVDAPLEAAETHLRSKILSYLTSQKHEPVDDSLGALVISRVPARHPGIAVRETYRAVVTSKARLIEWVASHPEHLDVLEVSERQLNALVQRTRGIVDIPGVSVEVAYSLQVRDDHRLLHASQEKNDG
jgi:hypothetical protein